MARKAVQRARREKSPRRTPERAVVAAPGVVPTLIGTLVKAGKFQEAILAGEGELRDGIAGPETRLCLARAYWGLAMAESAARQVDSLLKESRNVDLVALRAEIALTREESDPLQWLKELAKLDPEHELLARAPFSAAPPVGESLEALLERADWYLRRGNEAAAEANLSRAEALPAGIARASMLRWGWNREKALREAAEEAARKATSTKKTVQPSKSYSDELVVWLGQTSPAEEDGPAAASVVTSPAMVGSAAGSAGEDGMTGAPATVLPPSGAELADDDPAHGPDESTASDVLNAIEEAANTGAPEANACSGDSSPALTSAVERFVAGTEAGSGAEKIGSAPASKAAAPEAGVSAHVAEGGVEDVTVTAPIPDARLTIEETTVSVPVPGRASADQAIDSAATTGGRAASTRVGEAAAGAAGEGDVGQEVAGAAWLQDTATTSAIVDGPVRSRPDDPFADEEDEDPEEIVSGLFKAEDAAAGRQATSGSESEAHPVTRAREAQEEDVAFEEKHAQVTSAAPVDVEEMIVEADADDDEDGDAELYLLPNGIGAISLGLPFANRASLSNEDDEVVVIERGDRPQVIRGEVDTWFRGKQDLSWRTGGPVALSADPQIGRYGFDDEDEVATEVARWTPDGRLESVRRAVQLYGGESELDEDQEIIVPSQTTLPPGTRVGDPGADRSGGGARILNAIEEAAASGSEGSAVALAESTDAAAYARRSLLEARLAEGGSSDGASQEITGKLDPVGEPERTDTGAGRTAIRQSPIAPGREEVTSRVARGGADEVTNDLGRVSADEATRNLGRIGAEEVTRDLGRGHPDEKTRDLGRRATFELPTDPGGALQEKTAEAVRPLASEGLAETRILPGSSVAKLEDELDLEEISAISPIALSSREAEGPVARLAPTPARPLEPSAVRPPSAPPVPELPSLRTTTSSPAGKGGAQIDAEPGVAVPAPKISSPMLQQPIPFSRLRTTAPVVAKEKAAARPPGKADGQYFRRPEKMTSTARWPYAVVLAVAVIGALVFNLELRAKRAQELGALRQEMVDALGRGDHASIVAALGRLRTSELRSESDLADLGMEMSWILWADFGVKVGDVEPDPRALEVVSASSSVPLIAARAERDLWRHDYAAGRAMLQQALAQHADEPVLIDLRGRFELALAGGDSQLRDAAGNDFRLALDVLAKAGPTTSPASRARIQYDLGRALELEGKPAGEAYQAALAANPGYAWATVRMGIAAVPPEASLESADTALRAILDREKDKLAPRQRGAVYLERARRALRAGSVEKSSDLLADGERADENDSEILFQLGQLRNDIGQGAQAERLLTNAYRIAPTDLRIVNGLVTALLASNQGQAAVQIVNRVPAPFQEEPMARVVKSRLQRESRQLTGAEAQLNAAEQAAPDLFEAKLEHAMLKMAQKSADAASSLEKLASVAPAAGRPGLVPVLKAYQASLTSDRGWARAVKSVEVLAGGNARALMVLGESTYDHGDPAAAEKLLLAAQKVGDLPRIDLLIARIAAKDPRRKDEALQIARRVQGACGEGPTCDEASHLVETLQQNGVAR